MCLFRYLQSFVGLALIYWDLSSFGSVGKDECNSYTNLISRES